MTSKLSLRYGLWKRDPTNDLRVVRFCLSVPEGQYVQNGFDRALIRRSTEHLLPDNVRLNQRVRGVQGADWVHRMVPHWPSFVNELHELQADKQFFEHVNGELIQSALRKVEQGARTDYYKDSDYKILMRSIIVYRFMKKFA